LAMLDCYGNKFTTAAIDKYLLYLAY